MVSDGDIEMRSMQSIQKFLSPNVIIETPRDRMYSDHEMEFNFLRKRITQ
jgi:hypothetical protein